MFAVFQGLAPGYIPAAALRLRHRPLNGCPTQPTKVSSPVLSAPKHQDSNPRTQSRRDHDDPDRYRLASSGHGLPAPVGLRWGQDRYGVWVEFAVVGVQGNASGRPCAWIPPGRFRMGSPEDEPGRYGGGELEGRFNEGPCHESP